VGYKFFCQFSALLEIIQADILYLDFATADIATACLGQAKRAFNHQAKSVFME
jgi:hypothetical protein